MFAYCIWKPELKAFIQIRDFWPTLIGFPLDDPSLMPSLSWRPRGLAEPQKLAKHKILDLDNFIRFYDFNISYISHKRVKAVILGL